MEKDEKCVMTVGIGFVQPYAVHIFLMQDLRFLRR
jgi:hypothetical protein